MIQSDYLRKVEIPFGPEKEKSDREKYIYRLAILGIVEDYTVDWGTHQFEVIGRRSELGSRHEETGELSVKVQISSSSR